MRSSKRIGGFTLVIGLLALGSIAGAADQPSLSTIDRPADWVAVPAPSPEAVRHHESGITLWFVANLWNLAVPALILFSGLSSRIRSFAARFGRPWIVGVAIYAVLFVLLDFALGLPLRYYSGFVRPHDYGLSVQSQGQWVVEALTDLGVSLVGAVLFLWIPFAIMVRSPKRWWLYVGLLTLPFTGFMIMIAPVVIEPLFNHFGPMANKSLEAKIDALAHRAGIEGSEIFEVDKSKETKTVNAYVTGLLGTKRIVLWDTLLTKFEDDEVLAVMGHEMGHYVLNHVLQGLILSSAGTLLALYLIHQAANALIRRFRSRFGFDKLSDIASVPLILLLANVTIFLGSPVINGFSRHMEHEADRFALEITRANRPAALAFVKLQEGNLAVPYPGWLSTIWRSTHPPIGERIDFCNAYRPWVVGQPLRYSHLFRER